MRLFYLLSLFVFTAFSAQAVNIQKVVSKTTGVEAWLVESPQLPMVNVDITFRAGSAFEAAEKGGVASFTAALLSEGAGDMNDSQFTQSLDDLGARLGSSAGLLNASVSMMMLSENKEKSFNLLRLALTQPRFDEDAFSRMKDSTLSALKISSQNPGAVAGKMLKEYLYEGHPYGRPTSGNEGTVQGLTLEDVKHFYAENFTRKNMVVSVVGDITARELETFLDVLFADLKDGQERNEVSVKPSKFLPLTVRQEMPVPQSTIYLATRGITRDDPDYYAAYAMNYVLGGGGFNSRLMEEIREKRGLAYGVYSYFEPLPLEGSFVVSVSTKNKDAETSISLIKKEMARLKKHGITDDEYQGAMAYLEGSFPLRLDSSSKILGYLSTMQTEGLGIDYLDKWQSRMKAVTKADMERVAKRLLDEKSMLTIIVGGEE